MPNPWNLVGWMIVGAIAGVALAGIFRAIGESIGDMTRTPFARKLFLVNIGVFILLALWLLAPRWILVVVVGLTVGMVMLWFMRRPEPPEPEAEGGR